MLGFRDITSSVHGRETVSLLMVFLEEVIWFNRFSETSLPLSSINSLHGTIVSASVFDRKNSASNVFSMHISEKGVVSSVVRVGGTPSNEHTMA